MTWSRRVWMVLGLGVALPCAAQGPPADSRLSGQLELARVVDVAAQRLGLSVEYDAAALKGTVTLRLEGAVSDAELWALANRLLAARGFTTVRQGATLSVVRLGEAAGLAGIDAAGAGAAGAVVEGFTAVVVRLEHRPAREMVEALSKVLSKPGGSAAALSERLLLIADLAPRLEQARGLLALLDVPAAAATVEEIACVHLTPAALATLAAQVAAKRELVSGVKTPGEVLPAGAGVLVVAPPEHHATWRALLAQLDRREPVETRTYTPRTFGAREVAALVEQTVAPAATGDARWKLVVDELTGTLVVTATPAQHEGVAGLLARLDATPPSERRPVRSFVIRNRSVREFLPILQELLQAGVLEAATPVEGASDITAPRLPAETRTLPIPPAGPATAAPVTSTSSPPRAPRSSGPVALTADEATNTLIALGEARLLEQLEGLIRRLDVRQPQVMLEVLLVSLSDAQTLDLGLELERIDLDPDLQWRLSSLFGLSQRAGGSVNAGGAGLTGVVLNPGDFSIVLRALQTLQKGRSLSMPRVLVGNNQRATLDSVLEQPFASTNASNTVSTTSFAGSLPAGTQIAITPQIAEGDHLQLEYQLALSAFTGAASDPNLPPPRQQNRVQSVATIPDGFTVVVGGIELTTEGRSVSQVPLLGDLPVIGEAFKSRSRSTARQRFYVFIRANVLRAGGFEDLKHLSDVARAGMGAGGDVDDGFPRLKPRVIR